MRGLFHRALSNILEPSNIAFFIGFVVYFRIRQGFIQRTKHEPRKNEQWPRETNTDIDPVLNNSSTTRLRIHQPGLESPELAR